MFTVKLTEAEIAEKAQAMAQTGKRLFELDEMEEGVKADYKERIAEIKKERLAVALQFKKLSRAVTLGVEERDGQQPLFESITFSHIDPNGETKEIVTVTPEQLEQAVKRANQKPEPIIEADAPAISDEHGHLCPVCSETYLCNLACPEEMPERTCADCEEETEEPADKWTELLDEAEAELAAEDAARPEWESRELTFEDYLSYALTTGVKNPRKEAQRWFDSGQLVADVRHHLKTQAEQTKLFDEKEKPKPEPKRRKGKIKPHDEDSYQAGL